MRVKTRAMAAAAVTSLALLAACGGGGTETPDPGASESAAGQAGGEMTIRGCTPQKALLPASTSETCGGNILDAASAKLIHYNSDNAAPENDIAESIESDDNQNFTVKIKPDYKFHDGTVVKSKNFVDAWNYAAYGPNAQDASYFFTPVEGYADLQCGTDAEGSPDCDNKKPKTDKLTGLKVVDDNTFTIKTTEKVSNLPVRLGYTAFSPLPDSFFNGGAKEQEKLPIGAGPFRVTSNTATEIVLEKFADYSGANKPSVDKVTFRIYTSDAAAYTETNAAFHDYLFTLTGNEHLLRAYQALGVKGHMEESLRSATWCHPRCAQDHLDIVEAFRDGDRERARVLITEHAERSKETTRRAMHDLAAGRRPRFVTPGRFAGQVVLVTGAGQGIGERTARRISAEGGTLVLADRAELVRDLAGELGQPGAEALPVVADLETWEGAKSVVDAALARFGRIDVAIHTVGGTIWAKPFEHYPPEQIQAEINRSLWPTLWCCRAVVPHMVERGRGTIVNVSSVATRGVNRLPYAAAKGGVNAITTALALEMAPHGVRVVATAPGGTDAPPRRTPRGPAPETELEQSWYRSIVDQTVDSSLLKRYGTLDEQAAAITFLASEEASYITGTILPVAGGDLG